MQMKLPQLELHRIDEQFDNVPHVHDHHFQVTVPVRGACYFNRENKEYVLNAGESLVLNPSDRHSFRIGPDSGVIIIKVDERSFYPAHLTERVEPAFRHSVDASEFAKQFRKWTTDVFALDQVDPMAAEETESKVLSYLQRMLWADQTDILRGSGTRVNTAQTDRGMARVLEYVHAHYAERLNLDEMAAVAMQSRFYFIRSFKALTGCTPYQYVLRLRVEDAQQRLRRTADTVTDISFALGFSSASQFYRVFAGIVGMSPEKYRSYAKSL
ncbi:helix-turn-helix domain-containing protein [Cohnella faecalis]|nr:helix-turn-helix domain-containing protein [Cohnella faecalis]